MTLRPGAKWREQQTRLGTTCLIDWAGSYLSRISAIETCQRSLLHSTTKKLAHHQRSAARCENLHRKMPSPARRHIFALSPGAKTSVNSMTVAIPPPYNDSPCSRFVCVPSQRQLGGSRQVLQLNLHFTLLLNALTPSTSMSCFRLFEPRETRRRLQCSRFPDTKYRIIMSALNMTDPFRYSVQ